MSVYVVVVVVVVLVVTTFIFVCYYLSQTFFFLGARMEPREIEEVEPTGDIDSVKATGKEIVTTSEEKTRPPLTFLSIFRDAEIPIKTSDPSELCEMLRKGVFLKKYYAGVSLQSRKPLEPNCIVSSISLSPDLI